MDFCGNNGDDESSEMTKADIIELVRGLPEPYKMRGIGMPIFELSDYEIVELNSCDPDIAEAFKKIGGGYHTGLPTRIQMNRNIQELNKLLELWLDKSQKSKNCSDNGKNT